MNAGEWIGALVGITVLLGFLETRVLKPWRARLLAEAEEKRAVALIQSDEMRSAFRVLTGTDADPNQGVERVPSLGERMAAQERGLAEVIRMLNGGGLGSQMAALDAKITAQDGKLTGLAEAVDDSRQEAARAAGKAEEAARLAGGAAFVVDREMQVLATSVEDVSDRVDALDVKVERRLFVMEDAERTHRAMLHEVGFEVDLPVPPDDAA